jgi:hypothetical protein
MEHARKVLQQGASRFQEATRPLRSAITPDKVEQLIAATRKECASS